MPPKTPPPTAHTAAPGGPATLLPTAIPCCAPPTIPCAWAHSGNASAPARMPAIKVLLYIRPPDFLCERSASQSRAAQERLERGHCVFIEGLVPGSTKSVPGPCSVHEPKCSARTDVLRSGPKRSKTRDVGDLRRRTWISRSSPLGLPKARPERPIRLLASRAH